MVTESNLASITMSLFFFCCLFLPTLAFAATIIYLEVSNPASEVRSTLLHRNTRVGVDPVEQAKARMDMLSAHYLRHVEASMLDDQ